MTDLNHVHEPEDRAGQSPPLDGTLPMMPAQEEADDSFHECSRESGGRARPRERGNHRRCGLSTAADRSPAPGGGRLRWAAPGGRKVIRIGPGLGTAPEVEAGTISASALSHRSRAVPVLGAHGSRAPRRPARKAAMLGLEWPEVRRLFDERKRRR